MKKNLCIVILLLHCTPFIAWPGKKKPAPAIASPHDEAPASAFPHDAATENIIDRVVEKRSATPPEKPSSPQSTSTNVKKSIPSPESKTLSPNQFPPVMAILEHIFILQTAAAKTDETLTDKTSRSSATYTINSQNNFSITATISPTKKGVWLSRIWSSSDLKDRPFQALYKAFKNESVWTNATDIKLGDFFSCTRSSAYSPIVCTSGPALTKELFQYLKTMSQLKASTTKKK